MKDQKASKNRKRLAILFFFVTLVVFLVLAVRFSRIMITNSVDGHQLDEQVERLYTQQKSLPAKRGNIYDKNGESIAVSSTSYKMLAVLTDEWSQNKDQSNYVKDKEKTAKVLEKYISLDSEKILEKLSQEDVKQVEFGAAGSNLSYDTKKKIEEENLPGIIFEETPARLYPNGVFASHLIGIAQSDPESGEKELKGVMGLEDALQNVLAGKDGEVSYEKDVFGYAIPNGKVDKKEAEDGDDVYLTIDKNMQMYMESIVSQVNETNPSVAITATLMDPKTGDILAATQRPSFNASTKENIDETWQNYHVEYTFEPGSTMKILILAAAINEGQFNPNDTFLSGRYNYQGSVINDVRPEGWGEISYLDGLSYSSNVAFVKLFEKMGGQTWKQYLDAFGFGEKTGILLPNENAGFNPYDSPLQQANTAFGQGITATSIQMMQAFSAIANEGKMVRPQLVDKYVDSSSGEEKEVEVEEVGQPISKETAQSTLDYLSQAGQHPQSTTRSFQIEGYDIALKTGTSEIVDPNTGQYMTGENNNIYSVVGFAPANDPQYILYVTVQQPSLSQEAPHGSLVARDIFCPIMKWALDQGDFGQAIGANPSENESMPNLVSTDLQESMSFLAEKGKNVIVVGSGNTIVQQYPQEGMDMSMSSSVIVMTNGAMSMPDLTGVSKTDVLQLSEMTGLQVECEGKGYVSEQNIEAGASLDEQSVVHLKLKES